MHSSSCLAEFQAEVYRRVSTDPSVRAAAVGGVHDGDIAVPTVFPYVVIGEWTEVGEDIHTSKHRGVTVVIHVWSTYEGSKEAKQLSDYVANVLVGRSLDMPRWFASMCYFDNLQVFTDVSQTRHATLRLRWTVQGK